MMSLRRRLTRVGTIVVVLLAVIGAGVASAYLRVSSDPGPGVSSAATVGAGHTPSASVSLHTVSVQWQASTLSNSYAVDGYKVKRYPASGGAAVAVGGTCTGTVSALSCQDTSVAAGQWRYTATPVVATHWRGEESNRSDAVTVASASLALNQARVGSPDFTNGSATLTGSLSGFDAGESISYHLDSASGATLSGTPTQANGSGTASVSIMLPATTPEGTHTIYAIGDAPGANSSATSGGFLVDTTAPAGGSLAGPSTSATGAFTVTRMNYSEAGPNASSSGLASSVLTRAKATLLANSCQSYGAESAPVSGNAVESGLTTGCYRYTLAGTDNAGNVATTTFTVKVDTTNPSAPSLSFGSVTGNAFFSGTTVYTNPQAGKSGAFTLTATTSDADSGIDHVSFPTLTGFSAGGGDDSSSPFSSAYSWSGMGATAAGAKTVTSFNGVLATASATFAVVADTTAPTSGALAAPATNTTGGYTVTRTDYAEAGPNASASGLASSTLSRATATLTGSTCSAFGVESSPIVGSPVESGLSTGCYRYTLTGTDNVGNVATTSVTVQVTRTTLTIASVVRDGGNKKVHFTGTGAAATTAITVTICTVNSFPCAAGNTAGTSIATSPAAGNWTSAQSSVNLNNNTNYWAQAAQGAATSPAFLFTVTGL